MRKFLKGLIIGALAISSGNLYAKDIYVNAELGLSGSHKYFVNTGITAGLDLDTKPVKSAVEFSARMGLVGEEPMYFDLSLQPYIFAPLECGATFGVGLKFGFCESFYTSLNPFLEYNIDNNQSLKLEIQVSKSLNAGISYNYYF